MKDYPVSLVMYSMAKLIIWIVEVYGELTKAWLKYAVNKLPQHSGHLEAVELKLCTKVNKG